MGEWKSVSVSELGTIQAGSTPSTSAQECWDGEYVWLTPSDLSLIDTPYFEDSARKLTLKGVKKATRALLPIGSVIISCRAPVGYCAVSRCEFSFNQGCKAIVPFQGNEALYLYYFFKMNKDALERVSSGTTFLELPKHELSRFRVKLPKDIKEQEKIAEILTTVDGVIEKTRALIEKYKNIKTGLMQDLLTNGIDAHGNIRSPQTHKYKDSPLGRIPVEWTIKELGDVVICFQYGLNAAAIPFDGENKYNRITDIDEQSH